MLRTVSQRRSLRVREPYRISLQYFDRGNQEEGGSAKDAP